MMIERYLFSHKMSGDALQKRLNGYYGTEEAWFVGPTATTVFLEGTAWDKVKYQFGHNDSSQITTEE